MVHLKTYLGFSALFLLGYTTSATPVSSSSSAQLEARSYHGHGDFADSTPHVFSRDPGNDDDHDHHHHHISTGGAGGAGGAPGQPGQPGQPGEWTVAVSSDGAIITSKGGDGGDGGAGGSGGGVPGAPGAPGKVTAENPTGLNVSNHHGTTHSEHGDHAVSSGSLAVFGGSVPGPYWYCFAAFAHTVGYYVLTH